jgi:hypothetical protein
MKSEKGKAAINFHTILLRAQTMREEGGSEREAEKEIEEEANKMLEKLNKSFAIHTVTYRKCLFSLILSLAPCADFLRSFPSLHYPMHGGGSEGRRRRRERKS